MFMAGAFGELVWAYFLRHLPLYLALILLFVSGLGFGAVATHKLSPVQRDDLQTIFPAFIPLLITRRGCVHGRSILPKPDGQCSQDHHLLFLLGLTVIDPLDPGCGFLRGFALGFTVGFLVQDELRG